MADWGIQNRTELPEERIRWALLGKKKVGDDLLGKKIHESDLKAW